MTKVTINPKAEPSATQELLAKAQSNVTVTDARGRAITLKKPGALAQFRLIEALGDSAANKTYASMCLPLIYVAAVDGDPVMPPTRKSEVEALIQQLEEDGLEAVMEGISKHFASADPEKDKATLKN